MTKPQIRFSGILFRNLVGQEIMQMIFNYGQIWGSDQSHPTTSFTQTTERASEKPRNKRAAGQREAGRHTIVVIG